MSPPGSRSDLLVVVPCGRAKVWAKHPDAGPVPAADAYVGAPFVVNREYAQRSGADWMILSGKYGFILPTHIIPGPYEATFSRRATHPIAFVELARQVRAQGLDRYRELIGLGGVGYRTAIEAAFAGTPVDLRFPFAGMKVGIAMRATKQAMEDLPG